MGERSSVSSRRVAGKKVSKVSLLDSALKLAGKGLRVFPIVPGKKFPPLVKDFPKLATTNELQIRNWWREHPDANIGVSTDELLVVDVDNKGDKKGDDTIFELELEGFDLESQKTLKQTTPTGGRHIVFAVKEAVKQGVNVLGKGVDTRGKGGYIVGAGSVVDAGVYRSNEDPIALAPDWLISRCGRKAPKPERTIEPNNVDTRQASIRAGHYLENEAPIAKEGEGGDQTTFQVACKAKDFGVLEADAVFLMDSIWNPRCEPPWDFEEIKTKVSNAYRYGANPPGIEAPETQFTPIPVQVTVPEDHAKHPFSVLNQEYAFVLAGGGSHILWETVDHKGLFKLEHVHITAFHQKLASMKIVTGDGRSRPLSELWIQSPHRRSYNGICFLPGKEAPKDFYNLWRGFAVAPLEKGEKPTRDMQRGLDMFNEHALENVCAGDKELFRWLIGYFAHLVQRPWEKPLTALVFKGAKGTGKNALLDRVGHLLGNHYLLTSNRRYLVGNFNGHMENLLLFGLDEAFWSGDKQAEGTMKDLITGNTHQVEHKGKESYSVQNCTRIVIIGNEDWLVPATHDERRFTVFNVGDGRKQHRTYFQTMRECMERGGSRLLLRYLLDYDLTGIDVNAAPATQGLLDQKINSLEPFHQWWLECLSEGKVANSDFGSRWPTTIDKESFRQAFRRYYRERNIRSRIPEDRAMGKLLKTVMPSVVSDGKRREGDSTIHIYKFPPLDVARREWESHIGHACVWDEKV
jgi:hypothetical protein